MPAWPKSLFLFGINMLAAAAELNLLQRGGTAALQARAFKRLTRRLGATRHWREAGITAGIDYAAFRQRVAPCTHAQLASAIERMTRGERDVLWPGTCALFAVTTGTTDGRGKTLPVTEELMAHFRRAWLDALLCYAVRARHAGVFHGRHLSLGGTRAVTPLGAAQPPTAYAGDLGSIAALNQAAWAERHLAEPGSAIAQMTDWDAKLDAIVKRTRGRDITLLSALPRGALDLVAALRNAEARGAPRLQHLQAIWPNLECFVHHGVPAGPYVDELRAALGPTVNLHEVYLAAEGCLAVQDGVASTGLRVLSNSGIFFEFVPMAEFDEARLDQLGSKAVPLAEVAAGVDYAVLLTTPGGLARYALGDIVRFVSTTPPRFLVVGRTALRLDAFGERVNEKHLTDALMAICQKNTWLPVNFHVAPLFAASNTGQTRGRHEWWIELRPGTVATPIGPQMAAALDTEVQRLNETYATKRRAGAIEPPVVRLVMPGVFDHWLRYQNKRGGLHKLPRCRSDRVIADELAQITQFARD